MLRALTVGHALRAALVVVIPVAIFTLAGGASPPAAAAAAPELAQKDPVLSAYAIGSGSGTITSSPPGISCDRSCTASFPTGATVTLTATPTNGSSIRYWSNGICQEQGSSLEPHKGPTCTFVMSADRAVTVYFNPAPVLQLYFVGSGSGNVTSSPAGISCTASCKAAFPTGTRVTLTATPKAGSAIRYWSNENCREQGKSLNPYKGRTCTFVMEADRALTIYFDPAPTLFLYINGAGHVTSSPAGISCSSSCKQSFPTGTSVTLTATPRPGSTVYGWSSEVCAEQGKSLGTYGGRTCTLAMDAERSVSVSFVEPPRLEPAKATPGPPAPAAGSTSGLAVGVSGDGTVIGSTAAGRIVCGARGFLCYAQLRAGTRVVLRAVPAPASVFVRWAGACSGASPTCAVTVGRAGGVDAVFAARAKPERIEARLDRSQFQVRWRQSVATGSLVLHGFVARPSTLRIELRRPLGAPLVSADLRAAGAFTYTLRFSRDLGLLPGGFVVAVTGASGDLRLPLQLRTAALPAPPEGVVARAFVSRKRRGRPVAYVPASSREAWATFVFGAQPRPGLKLFVRWYQPDGKLLGQVEKPSNRASISSFLRGRPKLPTGAWRAELRVGTRIVKELRVPVGCARC